MSALTTSPSEEKFLHQCEFRSADDLTHLKSLGELLLEEEMKEMNPEASSFSTMNKIPSLSSFLQDLSEDGSAGGDSSTQFEKDDEHFGWFQEVLEAKKEDSRIFADASLLERFQKNHSAGSSQYSSTHISSKKLYVQDKEAVGNGAQDKENYQITSGKVLFSFSHIASSISCRSFGNDSIWISIESFRIVQSFTEGVFVEFLISLVCNGETFSCWKRFTDFGKLAQACGISTGVTRYICPTPKGLLPNSNAIWWQLERRKLWARTFNTTYLIWKCRKLEEFLQSLLFELHSPKDLLRFAGAATEEAAESVIVVETEVYKNVEVELPSEDAVEEEVGEGEAYQFIVEEESVGGIVV